MKNLFGKKLKITLSFPDDGRRLSMTKFLSLYGPNVDIAAAIILDNAKRDHENVYAGNTVIDINQIRRQCEVTHE